MGSAEVSMSVILKYSVPEQEFNYTDRCFPENDVEHRARYSVVIGHIYLDVELHSILKKFAQEASYAIENPEKWGFKRIIDKLYKHKKISDSLFNELDGINEARRAFAHELWPSEAKFHDKVILFGDGMQEIRTAIIETHKELKKINKGER